MSLLSELSPNEGSVKNRKRVGRGHSSGWGKTAGKGHKGQKARSGGKVRRGFEGGQTPIMRRLPKLGFTNNAFKTRYSTVSLDQLNRFDGEVSPELLKEAGLTYLPLVKVLGNGKIEKAITLKGISVTKGAQSAIEAAGGKVTDIPVTKKAAKKKNEKKS